MHDQLALFDLSKWSFGVCFPRDYTKETSPSYKIIEDTVDDAFSLREMYYALCDAELKEQGKALMLALVENKNIKQNLNEILILFKNSPSVLFPNNASSSATSQYISEAFSRLRPYWLARICQSLGLSPTENDFWEYLTKSSSGALKKVNIWAIDYASFFSDL